MPTDFPFVKFTWQGTSSLVVLETNRFVCSPPRRPYFTWSSAGPVAGTHCVQLAEGVDPHTWLDNYIATLQNHGFRWPSNGLLAGTRCKAITEPADPDSWTDNYLCAP